MINSNNKDIRIANLNKIFTKKLIDLVLEQNNNMIDKTYINTYNYLLANQK